MIGVPGSCGRSDAAGKLAGRVCVVRCPPDLLTVSLAAPCSIVLQQRARLDLLHLLLHACVCVCRGCCAGAAGPQGPAGKDGRDGAPGKDGKDGMPGRDGEDGMQGAMGE